MLGTGSHTAGVLEFGAVVAGPAKQLPSVRAQILDVFAQLQVLLKASQCTLRYDVEPVEDDGGGAQISPDADPAARAALLSRVLNVDPQMVSAALASGKPDEAWAAVRKASKQVERRRRRATVRT